MLKLGGVNTHNVAFVQTNIKLFSFDCCFLQIIHSLLISVTKTEYFAVQNSRNGRHFFFFCGG